jgi:Domain of unknown function (DUF4389)
VSAGRIVLLVFGAIFLLVAIVMLVGGGVLVWADQTLKDSEGFLTSDTITLESDSYAITTHPADINFSGWWPWGEGNQVTLKVEGKNNDSAKQIFIGIADEADVSDYLRNVNYDEIREFRIHSDEISYRNHPGSAVPEAPTAQTFWVVPPAYGNGTQTLKWDLESGEWVLVLMNADGSTGVDLSGVIGIKIPWIFGVGLGLLIGGIVLFIISISMIVLATRRGPGRGEVAKAAPGTPTPPEAKPPHPLTFKGELTEPLSQWLWLVKWFLLIPHFIVLIFLWIAAVVLWVLSLFAILFTSKYPRSFFDFNVGVLRWTWRVGFYSYMALGTDKYPPFTLKAGGYPADLDVPYPERLNSGLVLIKWWVLAVPHYIVLALFWGCGAGWGRWPGLGFVLVLFAAIVLLFTGKYPKDIYNLILGINRWSLRVAAYSGLMTDRYPPFRLSE